MTCGLGVHGKMVGDRRELDEAVAVWTGGLGSLSGHIVSAHTMDRVRFVGSVHKAWIAHTRLWLFGFALSWPIQAVFPS